MIKEKILIIEDERDVLKLLKYNLEKEGYKVLTSNNAEMALSLVRKNRPDLIILDIMLPNMDGLEFCRIVRQENQVPIIFLTAKKTEMDRILGLKMGADDYVTKPFSVEELIARVQAICRRMSVLPSIISQKPSRSGDIEVDFDRHEVRVKGKVMSLPPKEFELFKLLVEADGKVLSRDHLLEHIWGYDKSAEMDTRTVDQHIARLRKRLRSARHQIITIANRGYQIKFNDDAPAQRSSSSPVKKSTSIPVKKHS
jgi:two-component system alkaline phosphatase synthesis response regulator PhoP